jgi:hypothetical protein
VKGLSVEQLEYLTHFLLLQFERPGDGRVWPVAVLLLNTADDKLYVRGREVYTIIADAEDAVVLEETVTQLQADAREQGGSAILEVLESTLSNSLRITERIPLPTPHIGLTLDHLAAAFLL